MFSFSFYCTFINWIPNSKYEYIKIFLFSLKTEKVEYIV